MSGSCIGLTGAASGLPSSGDSMLKDQVSKSGLRKLAEQQVMMPWAFISLLEWDLTASCPFIGEAPLENVAQGVLHGRWH